MRAVSLRCTFALCASLMTFVALPSIATATSTEAAIAGAAAYVRAQQDAATGALPGFGGDWAATALAAAGVDTAEVRGPNPGDPSLQDFLLGEYTLPTWDEDPPLGTVAEYARSTLVSLAAGLDPARLSATSNQPAQLAGRWNPATGSFGEASSYNTAFAILSLKAAGLPRWALGPTVSFLRQNQHEDGGWTFTAALTPAAREEPSEEDMTGAAIAALCEAGVPSYDPAVASALGYLRGRLIDASGGIEYLWGFPAGSPNADTNAWVLSGLNACGVDPQSPEWTTSAGKTPVDYLLSLQVPSGVEAGGFGYEDASAANLYSSQDALRAIAGGVFAASPQSTRTAPSVAAGTPVPHLLAIELAPGNVRICKVTAAAEAPLTQLLAAAQVASRPAGCVSSFSTESGRVKSLNGVTPEGEDEAWVARLDRGAIVLAADQPVGFGDVIAMRIGQAPSSDAPAPAQGSFGTQGLPGPAGDPGKRGPRGRRGHHARKSCKARHPRVGRRPRNGGRPGLGWPHGKHFPPRPCCRAGGLAGELLGERGRCQHRAGDGRPGRVRPAGEQRPPGPS